MTGDATWYAGEPESGTVTFKALGTGESRMDLSLPDGTRTEIRDASTGISQGKWIALDGTSGMYALHNAMTDAVWFYSALGALAVGPNVVLSYVGLESRNGQEVQHLRSYVFQVPIAASTGPSEQDLSTMDFYLDATSSLPAAVVFNEHPDNNAVINIAIEVDFSNYQAISGAQIPMHVERLLNGSPHPRHHREQHIVQRRTNPFRFLSQLAGKQ